MIDAFNREVQGLDDVELWIHTCWGNPNMQRVMEDTSYAESIEIYLERCRGDVWTLEMKDRQIRDIELFAPFKDGLKKKIAIGAVSHRTLQADRPEDVAGEIRKALKYIPPEQLIVSSDCGFGRQGCNREIAFYKASAIAQGCNIVRRELGPAGRRTCRPPIRCCRSTSSRRPIPRSAGYSPGDQGKSSIMVFSARRHSFHSGSNDAVGHMNICRGSICAQVSTRTLIDNLDQSAARYPIDEGAGREGRRRAVRGLRDQRNGPPGSRR